MEGRLYARENHFQKRDLINSSDDSSEEEKLHIGDLYSINVRKQISVLYILKWSQDRARDTLEPAVPRACVTLSAHGWINEAIMMEYLSWSKIAMGHTACAIVPDSYLAHIAPRVRDKAARLEIEMVLVPRGLAREYQRLDCPCFRLFLAKRHERTRAEMDTWTGSSINRRILVTYDS
jgi:hypothetical protein